VITVWSYDQDYKQTGRERQFTNSHSLIDTILKYVKN